MPRQARLRWSIIGVGVAGRARAKAIQADARGVLVSVWRGKFADEVEARVAPSFEAAIQAADCVAICSPSAEHPDQVRAALEAGRHVVVEYPLAPDRHQASALFDLARGAGRVLHVEHIELLGAVPHTLRALVHPALVERAEVQFQRAGDANATHDELARGNVARIHRLVDAAGPIRSIEAVEFTPGRLEAKFTLDSGASVEADFQQSPFLSRRTRLKVVTPDATWEQTNDSLTRNGTPQTLLGTGSLFKLDQKTASARILDGDNPYVSDDRILHVLDVVSRLTKGQLGEL